MISPLTYRALELCSVSGIFTPYSVATAVGLGGSVVPERDQLWRALSKQVTEVLTPDYGWQIKPDIRRKILKRFVTVTQIDQAIETAPKTQPNDEFGTMLRNLMQRQKIRVEGGAFRDDLDGLAARLARCGALLDAVQFARFVPALDNLKLDNLEQETKRYILELQRRRDLVVVLPRRHFGYEKERRVLSDFLRSTRPDDDPRPMFVSGIGGVGKSALLARLFRYWQNRSNAPLTIVLDFDRRQLNAGAPKEMLKEVLRQAAAGIHDKNVKPEEAEAIAEGLLNMRRELTASDGGLESSFQTDSSYISIQIQEPLSADWAKPLRDWPIAVIFDSFEALDRRGGSNVYTVLQFESELRNALPRLRCIVSGREEPLGEPDMMQWFGEPSRRLRLTGISIKAGANLLAAEDRRLAGPDGALILPDSTLRRDAARALGGHPLALLMMLQFARARPDELADLANDLRSGNAYQAEFAQVFLYERILDRISDPDVRALAHPGLILRQFNNDMIRYVLAGPCLGHDPLPDADQAEVLRQKLAAEYWLVEPDDAGFQLKHRSDLRALMLLGLFATPRKNDSADQTARKTMLAAKAHDVCSAACRYFRDGPPPEDIDAVARWKIIPDRIRRVHGLYYEAFLTPDTPPDFDETTAREIALELGADIKTMPLAWTARIDALLGKYVSEAAFETLSGAVFEKAQKDAFEQETRAGRSIPIGKFEETRKVDPTTAATKGKERPLSAGALERQIAQAFDGLEFPNIAQLAPDYATALIDNQKADHRVLTIAKEELWHSPLWQVLLTIAAGYGVENSNFPDSNAESDQKSIGRFLGRLVNTSVVGNQEITDLGALIDFDFENSVSLDSYRFASRSTEMVSKRNKGDIIYRPAFLCLAVSGHPEEFSKHLPRHAKKLSDIVAELHNKKKITLTDLRRTYNRAEKQVLQLPAGIRASSPLFARMFRGLTPELYGPLGSLLEQTEQEEILQSLTEIRPEARLWPVEFDFDDKRKFRPNMAPALVETIDRLGVMRPFLRHLSDLDQAAAPLLGMYDCITTWFFPNLAAAIESNASRPNQP